MTPERAPTAQAGLPSWAVVTPARAEHVARVVALLEHWATVLRLGTQERARWLRAGWLHDAMRDAPMEELDRWAPDVDGPRAFRHGPAAAARAEHDGEREADVLSAVRWHTIGWPGWGDTGKALYAADFLEPGRPFDRQERAALAERFPDDRDAVLAEVIVRRMAYHSRKGREPRPETIELLRVVGG
jgi:2-amino-4-hydroxy-6-hydroxymethyldihydropteridine diphosphokinase